jgi:hypothetical protein
MVIRLLDFNGMDSAPFKKKQPVGGSGLRDVSEYALQV